MARETETGDDRGGRGNDDAAGDDRGRHIEVGDDNPHTVFGGAGAHDVLGGNGIDYFIGDDGADTLNGAGGNDILFGRGGNDSLVGGTGNDFLFGEAGNDTLVGGQGVDNMVGGAGADLFVVGTAPGPYDGIFDFNAAEGDKIQLTPLAGSPVTSAALLASIQLHAANSTFLWLGTSGGVDQWVILVGTDHVTAADIQVA